MKKCFGKPIKAILHLGDCLSEMERLRSNSIDSIVTDPPYELGFRGKHWDATGVAHSIDIWTEALRVLKPGGHLVAFAATRTYHRMACAIEDAGFDIRDQLAWVYGSGFPKSQNVGKMLDKMAGVQQKILDVSSNWRPSHKKGARGFDRALGSLESVTVYRTAPVTEAAQQWDGWGTALKPAWEPIILARKPLSEKTVALNVLKWGTGAINIDSCRINSREYQEASYSIRADIPSVPGNGKTLGKIGRVAFVQSDKGRWPANFTHDGSPDILQEFPNSISRGRDGSKKSVSAARFFYCAKASKAERNDSMHPTVKPVKLIRWLARLVTPPNGIILDPFSGTGTTGEAALLEGFRVRLIEKELEYCRDTSRRLRAYFI